MLEEGGHRMLEGVLTELLIKLIEWVGGLTVSVLIAITIPIPRRDESTSGDGWIVSAHRVKIRAICLLCSFLLNAVLVGMQDREYKPSCKRQE